MGQASLPAGADGALAQPRVPLRPGVVEALAGGLAVQVAWGHVALATTESGLSHAGNSWSTALQVGWSAAVAALLAVSGRRYAEFRRAGGNVRGLPALVGLALGLGLWRAGSWISTPASAAGHCR
ncbi:MULTISPECIES: hypothetical protein [Streptomyces]|uniref:hypothetical protein n=1 Tax=Streptomyces TaxID=1883 RepID=UPI0018DF1772|nr:MULTISPECIES: hypothetical protein [Streptomyces]MCZ4096816.1 hypothetical protein [Streptomyces sp. H39-C1]